MKKASGPSQAARCPAPFFGCCNVPFIATRSKDSAFRTTARGLRVRGTEQLRATLIRAGTAAYAAHFDRRVDAGRNRAKRKLELRSRSRRARIESEGQKGGTMIEETDREIEGAARIYERAKKWGHLPAAMTFESFLAALRRGDDPYLGVCRCGDSA
jgi:hypothetical protein